MKSSTGQTAHTLFIVLFIALLLAACVWILRPFLMSLLWATVIVIATWPVLRLIQRYLRNSRMLAVMVMAVLMLVTILLPVTGAVLRLLVLIDRGHREFPIQADYVGRVVATAPGDRINVRLREVDGNDEVIAL